VYPLVYPHSYAAQQDSRQERDILRQEATELRRALDDIQKRLAEIEGESSQA
jgi:predicted nuclease with TOPRIM domain